MVDILDEVRKSKEAPGQEQTGGDILDELRGLQGQSSEFFGELRLQLPEREGRGLFGRPERGRFGEPMPITRADVVQSFSDALISEGNEGARALFDKAREEGRVFSVTRPDTGSPDLPPMSEDVILKPEAIERVQRIQREQQAFELARRAQEPGAFSRIGQAIASPFQDFEERALEAGAELGFAPRQGQGAIERFSRETGQAGTTLGLGALSTVEAATQGVGQLLEETLGIPAEEAIEFIDIAGLVAGAKPTRMTPQRAPRRALTRQQEEFVAGQRNIAPQTRITVADVTQDQAQQALLEDARKGMLGAPAQRLAEEAVRTKSVGLLADIEDIRRRATRRVTPLSEPGEGVQLSVSQVRDRAASFRRQIRDAYDEAQQADASIEGRLIADFGTNSRARLLDDGFDVEVMDQLSRRLGEVENFRDLNPQSLRQFENWRKRVNRSIQSVRASDPAQAEALRRLKGDYDEFLAQALDEGLIRGNDQAVRLWRTARDLRADFGRRFSAPKVIDRIVSDDLTQEEALNLILGGSRLGFANRAGSSIQAIKRAIGPDNPAIDGMRQEFFLRLLRNQPPGETFSGARFRTSLNRMLEDNPTVVRELFNNNQIREMRNFADFAERVTTSRPGVINTSSTAAAIQRNLGRIPVFGDFANSLVRLTGEERNVRRVRELLDINNLRASARRDPELLARVLAVSVGGENDE